MRDMPCKICSADAAPFATARVLNRYVVQYLRCVHCGAVQTEPPFWLEAAYSSAITTSDLGLVSRNVSLARTSRVIIRLFFRQDGTFVDYGGGYGLFVRLMRDDGFNFFRYDRYCENLFAKGFDADLTPTTRYELVTAFEVFEHLVDPPAAIEEMLGLSDNILFSTLLLPRHSPKPGEWWYYGLEHGQHVVLYTAKALAIIAQRHGLFLYSKNDELHLLTKKKIPQALFKIAASRKLGGWLDRLSARRSLLEADYAKMVGTTGGSQGMPK